MISAYDQKRIESSIPNSLNRAIVDPISTRPQYVATTVALPIYHWRVRYGLYERTSLSRQFMTVYSFCLNHSIATHSVMMRALPIIVHSPGISITRKLPTHVPPSSRFCHRSSSGDDERALHLTHRMYKHNIFEDFISSSPKPGATSHEPIYTPHTSL